MENDEFRDLIGMAGWSQAETARQLGMTSGAVNQIVKGSVKPSPVTMRLLKLLVAPGSSGSHQGQTDWRARAIAAETALEQIQSICSGVRKKQASISETPQVIPPDPHQGDKQKVNSDEERKMAVQAIQHLGKGVEKLSESPKVSASRIAKTKSSHGSSTKE